MLFYVEQGVAFTCTYGDVYENFYSSMVKMFNQVAMECDRDEELYKVFSTRLRNLLSNADGTGWGFQEALVDYFIRLSGSMMKTKMNRPLVYMAGGLRPGKGGVIL
jgi:hypothetical protein